MKKFNNINKRVFDVNYLLSDSSLVIQNFGNASSRSNDGFVIKPSGVDLSSSSSDEMVSVDLKGNILNGKNGKPIKTGRYEQDKPDVPKLRERSKKRQAPIVAKKEKDMGTKLASARTTKDKKETYASKVQRGGGFSKGGLASKPKKK